VVDLRGPLPPLLHPRLRAEGAAAARAAGDGLWALPVLSAPARWALLAELEAAEAARRAGRFAGGAPNSMHSYGVLLSDLGLEGLGFGLAKAAVEPLIGRFPGVEGPVVDAHAFAVSYGRDRDEDLGLHVDDSTLTLTLCLGCTFTGGEVVFEGARCPAHRQGPCWPDERQAWAPRPGLGLVHRGAHRHHVRPVGLGRRVSLVVWARVARRDELAGCAPWCGGG
jgi:hypothetical protein